MNRIKVGISCLQPGWKIILNQEGIPFEVVSLKKSVTIEDYSLIIVSNSLDNEQEQIIKHYQKEGGSVLRLAKDIEHSTIRKRFLIAQNDSIFSDIGIVDVNGKIFIPKEGTLFYEDLQIFSDKIGKGKSLILPFDVNKSILDTNKKRRRFFAERKELPSEIVTKISKNKIRQIVRISLEYLHHQRNLPFVQKWYFPKSEDSIFIFRIDTDFCSAENANELLQICRKNRIVGCWFVDTVSENTLSETYAKMEDQEVGLHCYRHLVFDDYKQNYENIKIGMLQLEKVGIDSKGYVAPFGDWNENLGKVLDNFKFDYSSEFTLNYDDLPFFPFINGKFSDVLQIPIHPISMGRLNRSHFSKDEIVRYYKNIILKKMEQNEPIILYHHPSQLRFDLWDEIFAFVNKVELPNLTMKGFSDWWKKRDKIGVDCIFENGELSFTYIDSECFVRVSTKEGFNVLPQKRLLLSEINWKKKKTKQKRDFSQMRKYHWREILYNYESKRARKNL